MKAFLLTLLMLPGLAIAQASNAVFPAQIFTATGQTGTVMQLNGIGGGSYSAGTIALTGTSLTAVTFSVFGSSDGGVTYYQLPITTVASPGATPTTTATASASGLYQVNLLGITHVKFTTSGTFTGTSISLVLSASPTGTVSRAAPVLNPGAIASAQMPTSGWTAYDAYGDSITSGSDATTTANKYVNLIDVAVGSPTLTNLGVAGMTGCDMPNQVFNNENPGATSTVLVTMMSGINDATSEGPGVLNEATFNNCELAAMSWVTIPSTLKIAPTVVTNWTADATYSKITGVQSTTHGAGLTIPYTTSVQGQSVFLWYRMINANGGIFQVSDSWNSQVYYGFNNSLAGPLTLQSGLGYSVGVIAINGQTRPAGSYTLTVQVDSPTAAGNIVSILGAGVSPPVPYASTSPSLWVGGVARVQWDNQSAATAIFDNDVRADVAQLWQDGLNVFFAPIRNFYFSTAYSVANPEMGQGAAVAGACGVDPTSYWKHPCNLGHQELANAFLSATVLPMYNPYPSPNDPTQYTAVNTYTTSQTLTCANQIVFMNVTAAATITMPLYCATGKSFFIVNSSTSTATSIFVQPYTGTGSGGNVSGFNIYPGQGVFIFADNVFGNVGTSWWTSATGVSATNLATIVAGASNITSATCTAFHCTAYSGYVSVVTGSGFTTGTLATINFTATGQNLYCSVSQAGGSTYFGVATTPGSFSNTFVVTNTVSAASQTINFAYICTGQQHAYF